MLPDSLRNSHLWLPGYLRHRLNTPSLDGKRAKVWLAIADHYEPYWRNADDATALERVRRWRRAWPAIAARHKDSLGRPPKYTFFYAEEEYHAHPVSLLAEMAAEGIADVEVHLHHDGEGECNFTTRIRRFVDVLYTRHGLLREVDGKLPFGFIHGNWALDNSRPDGRRCGLNNEITLLKQLGCYADFTLPSAPSPAQTAMVNTIYWATDDPQRPKSHNRGVPLVPGGPIGGDLLLIPGPLGFNRRGGRLLPRLETGELAAHDPPVKGRASSWLDLAPRVGNNIFVKLFSHGTQEANSAALLGRGLDDCFDDVRGECERRSFELCFASTWEMRAAAADIRGVTRAFPQPKKVNGARQDVHEIRLRSERLLADHPGRLGSGHAKVLRATGPLSARS